MDEFSRMLGRVRAERRLVIADVCHSRNILLPGTERGAKGVQSQGARELFTRLGGKGCLLLGYDGLGREDDRLRHGYLTAFLLKGLAGPADLDKNGKIMVTELKNFISKHCDIPGGGEVWLKGEGDIEFLHVSEL